MPNNFGAESLGRAGYAVLGPSAAAPARSIPAPVEVSPGIQGLEYTSSPALDSIRLYDLGDSILRTLTVNDNTIYLSGVPASVPPSDLATVAFTGSATDIGTGTLADARLSSNVPLKNAANTFTGANTFNGSTTLASSSFIQRTDGNFLLGWDASGDYVAAGSNFGTARPLNIGGHHTDIFVRNAGTVRSKWFANGNFQVGNLSDLGTLFQVAGTANIQGAAQFGSTLSVTGAASFSTTASINGILLKNAASALNIRNSSDTAYWQVDASGISVNAGGVQLRDLTTNSEHWRLYKNNSDPTLYLQDMVNARMLVQFGAGATSGSAFTIFLSNVNIDAALRVVSNDSYIGSSDTHNYLSNTTNFRSGGVTRAFINGATGAATFNGLITANGGITTGFGNVTAGIFNAQGTTRTGHYEWRKNGVRQGYVGYDDGNNISFDNEVGGYFTFFDPIQVGLSGNVLRWSPGWSAVEIRDSSNVNYGRLAIGDLRVTNETGGSLATPGNVRIGLMTQSLAYLAGAITGRTYSNNAGHGDVILSANSVINTGVVNYSNLTDDLVIRGNTGNVEINRGQLVLSDLANSLSWKLKTQTGAALGQLDFISHTNDVKASLSQAGRLTLNGAVPGGNHVGLIINNIAANAAGVKTQILLPVFNGSGGGVIESIGNSINGYRMNLYHVQPSGILTFGTGGDVERMRIDATGNVIVGTGTPYGRFNLYGGGAYIAQDQIVAWHSAGTVRGQIVGDSTNNIRISTRVGGVLTEGLIITSSGNTIALGTFQADEFISAVGDKIVPQTVGQPWQFLNSSAGALGIKVGNLVVSNSYSDVAPTNGLFVKGNTQIVGTLTLAADVWHGNSTNPERLYFATNAGTAYMGYGATPHLWRNNMSTDIMWLSSGGNLTLAGRLQVGGSSGPLIKDNGGTLQIRNGSDTNFAVAHVGQLRVGPNASTVFSIESDSYISTRVSTAIAVGFLATNSLSQWSSQVSTGGDWEVMQYAPIIFRRLWVTQDGYVNTQNQLTTASAAANHSMRIRAITSQTGHLLRFADVSDVERAFIDVHGSCSFSGGPSSGGGRFRVWGNNSMISLSIGSSAVPEAFQILNAGNWWISTTQNIAIELRTNNTTRMTIAANGDISCTNHITSAFQSLSADPSTLDISSGLSRLVKNTTSGEIRHWVNDGGVMKKSPAYT